MAYTSRVNQIATVVDSVFGQAIGGTNLTSANSDGLVSMGDKVLSSSSNKEQFYNVLMDRISKVIPVVEVWNVKKRKFMKNAIEFGNALQMMTFEAGSNSEDRAFLGVNSWQSATRGTQNSPFDNTVNTTAKQYIFDCTRSAWEYDDVIPDIQIKTAFTNPENMAAFIGGIYQTHKNKLAEDCFAVSNIIGARAFYECCAKANASTGANTALFRNILAEYNKDVLGLADPTATGGAITYPTGWVKAGDALKDTGFMAYFIEQLQLQVKRFADVTKVFNIDGHTTQCMNPVVEVLQTVASASKVAFANTYHNDILSLPNYDEISYWQASAKSGETTYGFNATSSVSVGVKVSNTSKTFSASGIVAFVYDEKAIMQTVEDYRSYSLFNPKDEVLNTYDKANIAYAIAPFKNMVVFQIADPTASGSTVSIGKSGIYTVA